ncbi:MAG: DUF72 domain-containing protein [Bacteroidota bacterium]
MKFGKLNTIEGVDFSLPANPERNQRVLQKTEKTNPQLYIGCTGWGMKEWIGNAYPKGAKNKDFLKYYGQQFNTIELNTTHYRIPDQKTIEKWKTEVPKDFRYCPKILQAISHRNDLGINSGRLLQFCEAIQGLEEQLGCSFVQMPPYFDFSRLDRLAHFLSHFPKHIPLAVELRHESWFNDPAHSEALFALLEAENCTAVITDVAGRRDVLHQRLTNGRAMIRFVGNGLHPSDYQRIDAWVDRLVEWFAAGLNEIYFFPHEPDNLLAPEIALYLAQQFQKKCSIPTRGPQLPFKEQQQQMTLF